jgi:hypothetical protein
MITRASSTLAGVPTGTQLRTSLYALAVSLYLVAAVARARGALTPVLSALSLVAILVALPACARLSRALAAAFLAGGSFLLWHSGCSWSQYLGAYGEMLYLLALFAVVPVLTVPIRLGGYGEAIQAVLRGRVRTVFQLNCFVTTLSFVCGAFVNMAAVPIMMASMGPAVERYPLQDKVRFTAVSATYGYVLSILWTPVSGVVGLVVSTLHVEWLALLPALLALSVAGLVCNWIVFYLFEAAKRVEPAAQELAAAASGARSPGARLLQLLACLGVLLVTIGLLERLIPVGFTTIVTLAAAPFALVWCAALGRGWSFLSEARRQLGTRLAGMSDQFAVFLSVGFFTSALHISGADHGVNLVILQLRDALGAQAVLMLLPLMAVAISFIGVHPLAAIGVLAESLKPEVLGITPTRIAISLVGGSALTYLLGPFSGTLGLVQSINHVSTYRLSWWNASYAVAFFVLLTIAIAIAS